MTDFHPQGQFSPDRAPDHEHSDVAVRGIVSFGVALVLVVLLCAGILSVMMRFYTRDERRQEALKPVMFKDEQGLFPEPKLENNETTGWDRMRADDEFLLNTPGWVDRKAGIARIPIDRAIELALKKGFPSRKTPPAGSPAVRSPGATP